MVDTKVAEKLDKMEVQELVAEKLKSVTKLKTATAEIKSAELSLDKLSDRLKLSKLNQKLEAELEIIVHIEKILKDREF